MSSLSERFGLSQAIDPALARHTPLWPELRVPPAPLHRNGNGSVHQIASGDASPSDRDRAVAPGAPPAQAQISLAEHKRRLAAAYRRGFAAGYARAQEQAASVRRQIAEDVAALGREIARRIDEERAAAERRTQQREAAVVELAVTIARHILKQELSTNPEAILPMVRHLIGESPKQALRLFASPRDIAILQALACDGTDDPRLTVEEDPALQPGDVILQMEHGRYDLSIDKQLAHLAEQLEREASADASA